MQTTTSSPTLVDEPAPADDFVSASFEACAGFDGQPDASPVCAACGWLVHEHQTGVADVHTLPTRSAPPAATRLAS